MLSNSFIVWYLFLGGLGAGLYLAAFVIRLRTRKHAMPRIELYRATWQPALIGSFATLAIGCVFLAKDLALFDSVLLLFVKPTLSALSIGTYALICLLVGLAVLIALSFKNNFSLSSRASVVVEVFVAIIALVVILYTGVLLSSVASVPLWHSVFVPVLFLLSSLSSGVAGMVVIVMFVQSDLVRAYHTLAFLLRADAIIIVLEVIVVTIVAVQLQGTLALSSLESLATGSLSGLFWIGFVGCGLLLPLVLECVMLSRQPHERSLYFLLGASLLAGAFFLRYLIIFGGVHISTFMFS